MAQHRVCTALPCVLLYLMWLEKPWTFEDSAQTPGLQDHSLGNHLGQVPEQKLT